MPLLHQAPLRFVSWPSTVVSGTRTRRASSAALDCLLPVPLPHAASARAKSCNPNGSGPNPLRLVRRAPCQSDRTGVYGHGCRQAAKFRPKLVHSVWAPVPGQYLAIGKRMRALLEVLGILANLVLSLYCVGLAALGWIDGGDLLIPLLPVAPENAGTVLALAGTFGAAASWMGLRGGSRARIPLLLWSVTVLALLVAAVFRSGYRFDGTESFAHHGLLMGGAAILLVSSYSRYRSARRADQRAMDRRRRLRWMQ